ncbi:MAG: hypothetical protein K2J77_06175 [Oscillospiraceae bacterium]|nr:hypothetical protein [Oscillospiraceae bacterium]
MKGFTKSEFALSIACSSLTLLWVVVRFVLDIIWETNNGNFISVRLVYLIAALVGGVLPIILTIALRVHTERYFVKRAVVTVVAVVIIYSVASAIMVYEIFLVYQIGVCVAGIMYDVLKNQDEATIGRERAVLFLSNPLIYWIIKEVWYSLIYFMTADL